MTNAIEKRKEFEEFRMPNFGLKFSSPPCVHIVNNEYPFEAGDIVYSEEISFDGVHTWQGYPATVSSYVDGKSVLERQLLNLTPGEHSVSLTLYITDGRIITSTRRAIVVDDDTVLWIHDLLNEDESLFNTESGDVLIQE
jgi:hypothetical protein